MSKTRRFGGDGYFGEVPALKDPEDPRGNAPSGLAETAELGAGDYFEAPMQAEGDNALGRVRRLASRPVEEWPLEDLQRVVDAIYGTQRERVACLATEIILEVQEPRMDQGCKNPECGVSRSSTDQLTFGSGRLSLHGYWQFPCRKCAEDFKMWNPEMAAAHGVWPSNEEEAQPDLADDPAVWGEVLYDEDDE